MPRYFVKNFLFTHQLSQQHYDKSHGLVFSHTLSDPEQLPWSNRIKVMVIIWWIKGHPTSFGRKLQVRFTFQRYLLVSWGIWCPRPMFACRAFWAFWMGGGGKWHSWCGWSGGRPCQADSILALRLWLQYLSRLVFTLLSTTWWGNPLPGSATNFRACIALPNRCAGTFATDMRCIISLCGWVYRQWEP